MALSTKALLAVFTVVILGLATAFGAYYADTSSELAGQRQTISGLQSTVSSLVSQQTISTTTEYGCVPEDLDLSEVTLDNGSETWFPQQVCLPVTSTYYPAISATYSDPRFTALENGSSFIFFDSVGASRGSTNNVTDQFLFNDYVLNDTFEGCGSQAVITPILAKQISVDVVRYSSNAYDMAHANMSVTPPYLLSTYAEACNAAPLVLPLGLVPPRFGYGGAIFETVYNGLYYQHPGNLTIDTNYNVVLAIAVGGGTQTVDFQWGSESTNALPSPASYVAFNGSLHMNWFLQSSSNGVLQAYLNATLS